MKKELCLGLIVIMLGIPHALAFQQGDYYVRVDAGQGQTKLRNVNQSNGNTDLSGRATGFVGSLGFGHYLSDNLSVAVQAHYDNGLKAKSNTLVSQSRKKTMAGFVNFACDFLPQSSINPYIMAGVGYGQTRFDLTKNNVTFKSNKKGKRGFLWQGGVGMAYSFTENFALDVGYRLLNNSSSKKRTCVDPTGNMETCKSNVTQVVLGGFRYTF